MLTSGRHNVFRFRPGFGRITGKLRSTVLN
jgi:hypothetical protein